MSTINLMNGDCLEKMKELADNSVDSIVSDPPYGLSFMNKKWDYQVPSKEIWTEALRVLKPGGHLLAFGGTRTYHRLVVNIEDAGFEIRDQIQWLYGSGFPKSTDVSKRIDKEAGAVREVIGTSENNRDRPKHNYNSVGNVGSQAVITKPSTDQAKQWQGWGTALKPANEPICVARKPLEKGLTVAQNVLKWGTGAINIDESRIATEEIKDAASEGGKFAMWNKEGDNKGYTRHNGNGTSHAQGRWPANIILDETAAEMLDTQAENVSRFFYCAKASKSERNRGLEGMPEKEKGLSGNISNTNKGPTNALRPDAPTKSQNFHPTVKPIKLMEYLIKLVTPKNGTVMDPFMGSGSTGVAAKNLGFKFIGIELNPEYVTIAEKRIESVEAP